MKQIEIPFLEQFHEDIKNGQKIMTTRSKRYGEAGDFFVLNKEKLTILAVFKMRLWHIAYHFHDAEGFGNPQGFIDCWNKLHPKRRYAENKQVHYWVHVFVPIFEEEKP
jgi:hypothetical protein